MQDIFRNSLRAGIITFANYITGEEKFKSLIQSSRAYVGAGELKFKMVSLKSSEKTKIAEGQGLLLVQNPYRNVKISAFIISSGVVTAITDTAGLINKISVNGEEVFMMEDHTSALTIYIQSFLVKKRYYVTM